MKRLVWLLLAVFCTALAQVQPVTVESTHRKCCCCGGECSCGMRGCLPPAQARTVPTAHQPAGVTVTETRQVAAPVRRTGEKVFAGLLEIAAVVAVPRAPAWVTRSANAPLFAVHCSYLI